MEDPTLTLKKSKISTQKHGILLKFGFSRIHTAKVIQTLSLSPVYQLSLALVRKTGGKGKEPGASRLQCNKRTTSRGLGGFTSPPPLPPPPSPPKAADSPIQTFHWMLLFSFTLHCGKCTHWFQSTFTHHSSTFRSNQYIHIIHIIPVSTYYL